MEFDTIAAISTPLGEGGIAVIRVSGPQAIEIADRVFRGKQKLTEAESHTIHYGHLIQPEKEEIVDEVLVSVMLAPRTFTRENVVEVNCHGGIVPANRTLGLLLENGARLAEPGEFTKRAFLNGRIDLSQAEAVIDLIRSKTDRAMKVAMEQMNGRLSYMIRKLRARLLKQLAHIEVTIDYPEHDVDEVTRARLFRTSKKVKEEIDYLLETAQQGKILREGISTVIIGRPNVGKSSLLNAMVHESKAIVTDIPGTTRDVIEEYVNVRGVPLRLVDTAGIRETQDIVEKIGVERSRKALQNADLILLVLNYGDSLDENDLQLFDIVRDMKVIVIINKSDLPQKIDLERVKKEFPQSPLIATSLLEDSGVDELEKAIAGLFFSGQLQGEEVTWVSNARHIALLKQARVLMDDVSEATLNGIPVDMVAFDIRRTWELLGEIIGEEVHEDLIDQIFAQFCLGK